MAEKTVRFVAERDGLSAHAARGQEKIDTIFYSKIIIN